MPPATKTDNKHEKYVSPFGVPDFKAASEFIKLGEDMRWFGRELQRDLHTLADEVEAALTHGTGNVWERHVAKRKAKKVARHLRSAADGARVIAVDGVKMTRGFRREYADLIDPPKKSDKNVINWKE